MDVMPASPVTKYRFLSYLLMKHVRERVLNWEIRFMMTKCLLLRHGTIGLEAVCFASWWAALAPAAEVFEVTHSDADWRKLLTPDQ
jgi:hypothetical protein